MLSLGVGSPTGCPLGVSRPQLGHQDIAAAKTYDDQVHSFGSSSSNIMTPPPTLDVQRTLASFPPIDTHGDLTAMVVYMSAANIPSGFYDLIERFVAFGP